MAMVSDPVSGVSAVCCPQAVGLGQHFHWGEGVGVLAARRPDPFAPRSAPSPSSATFPRGAPPWPASAAPALGAMRVGAAIGLGVRGSPIALASPSPAPRGGGGNCASC
eukprot:2485045-Pyramimonas_sp.AAC.1